MSEHQLTVRELIELLGKSDQDAPAIGEIVRLARWPGLNVDWSITEQANDEKRRAWLERNKDRVMFCDDPPALRQDDLCGGIVHRAQMLAAVYGAFVALGECESPEEAHEFGLRRMAEISEAMDRSPGKQ